MKTIITGMEGRAIYNYGIFRDCIELYAPGTVCTISDPEEIKTIKSWIQTARKFAKNKPEICTYIEYMIDYGQYETA